MASDGDEVDHFGCSVSISGDYAIIGAYEDTTNKNIDLFGSGSAYIYTFHSIFTPEPILSVLTSYKKIPATSRSFEVIVRNTGSGIMNWTVTSTAPWITIDTLSGTGDTTINISYADNTGPERTASVAITAAGAKNSPEVIEVVQAEKDIFDIASTEQKIVAWDGAGGYRFGYSVSVSGDYAIVGANGSSYIFMREEDVWAEQAKLLASDGVGGYRFGYSVSVSGDYAIVGAYCGGENGFDSGSAYIFKRDGKNWVEQQKLLASDSNTGDLSGWSFGWSVSISGDYAIVGAYCDGDNGFGSGSAYIFKRDGDSWTEQAKLLPSDGAKYNYFGNSVSISGDYIIVGGYGDDDNGSG